MRLWRVAREVRCQSGGVKESRAAPGQNADNF
jgi:hypothetical protein